MPDLHAVLSNGALPYVVVAFLLGGFVKGVVGFGLPSVALGLLALKFPPAAAAAILALPSAATNVWQALAGPYLVSGLRRIGPFLAALIAGTLAGRGWMTGTDGVVARKAIGALLVIYGLSGFVDFKFTVTRAHERWLGPLIGLVCGLINAVAVVFVLPLIPYLQALDMERDEFVQVLGLVFLTGTLALSVNLIAASALVWSDLPIYFVALLAAAAGMALGTAVRHRLPLNVFRRVLFGGLILLGLGLLMPLAR